MEEGKMESLSTKRAQKQGRAQKRGHAQNRERAHGVIRFIGLIAVTIVSLYLMPAADAIADSKNGLFLPATGEQIKKTKEADQTVIRQRTVFIDFSKLPDALYDSASGIETTIEFNLFPDVLLTGVIDSISIKNNGDKVIWSGYIKSDNGSSVHLVRKDNVISGNIRLTDGRFFQVRFYEGDTHLVIEIDQSMYPEDDAPVPVETPLETQQNGDTKSLDKNKRSGTTTIDVLVVYTSAAKTAAGSQSAIESLITLAETEANESFTNSGIDIELNVVHTAQTNYTETSMSTELSALRNTNDGKMDSIHTLRDDYGADLVQLWVSNGTNYCGLGYLMTNVSSSFASYAFSVVRYDCATGTYTFAHELGHNMGAEHDRYVATTEGAYSYSYGYVNTTDKWRTIMAYNDKCSDNGYNCTRINYWSNPDVSYDGVPTGKSASASNSANNALTLTNTAATIAAFKDTADTAAIPALNISGAAVFIIAVSLSIAAALRRGMKKS
ncbi:Peptidyl-Asp metalloendopeptidase [Candidatus Magnetoovum chiemensis]|nr:Peptidyl-Asp metalloendopeptidase [Candidatus Magnetoovum chiemensis]